MAIIGLNVTAERYFVSKYDEAKGTDGETKWLIGTLDSRILGLLQDKSTTVKVNPQAPDDEVDTQINNRAYQFEVCQFGLRGWDGFKDEEGNDIPYSTIKLNRGGRSYVVVDPVALNRVPIAVVEELAQEIMKKNILTAKEGNA